MVDNAVVLASTRAGEPDAFEYPTFKEHEGSIWLTISGRNQRTILFGQLVSTSRD